MVTYSVRCRWLRLFNYSIWARQIRGICGLGLPGLGTWTGSDAQQALVLLISVLLCLPAVRRRIYRPRKIALELNNMFERENCVLPEALYR